MSFAIVTSSPKALSLQPLTRADMLYPFDSLEVGQSFTMLTSECNWKSLRTVVSQRNIKSKGEKEYRFLKHDDLVPPIVEVARIK